LLLGTDNLYDNCIIIMFRIYSFYLKHLNLEKIDTFKKKKKNNDKNNYRFIFDLKKYFHHYTTTDGHNNILGHIINIKD